MSIEIAGTWELVSWRRLEDGEVSYPLGESVTGVLIYTPDFHMSVQMFAGSRAAIDSTDPLGGTEHERAAAYSTCLAYFGTYDVEGETVHHCITASLYPNWSGQVQARPLDFEDRVLVLRTPPSVNPGGKTVVNEIRWKRYHEQSTAEANTQSTSAS